jgi:hypothetical protein
MKEAQQKANSPLYAWLTVWLLTHKRRYHGIDQVLGCNGVGIDIHKIINSFTEIKTYPELIRKPKFFFHETSPHLGTPDQKLSMEQSPATCHGLDYIVTSYSPRITSSQGTDFVWRFCAILNQKKEINLTYAPNQAQINETKDTTIKSIAIRQAIRTCSDPNIDKDKYGGLQKRATDSTQISNPNKGGTNNADNQHRSQSQPWGKKENEITLNKIGQWENKTSNLADASPMGPGDSVYQEDKTKIKNQNLAPHEIEAEDTQRELEDAYQTHHAEMVCGLQECYQDEMIMDNEDSKSTQAKKSHQQT